MARANGIESSGGTPPFAGPFPERRKPSVAPRRTLRSAVRGGRLRRRRAVSEPGSGRDVLSRTVRKGPGKCRRTAQQADTFALGSRTTERRDLLGQLSRTVFGDPGAASKKMMCKTCTPRAVWEANTSYRDRARQDVAPGGSMDGFTPFAVRRIGLPNRAQIAALVLSY